MSLPDHHILFIGRANSPERVDPETVGQTFQLAIRHAHDRSNFPNRHHVSLDILEHVAGPGADLLEAPMRRLSRGSEGSEDPEPPRGRVAIATGRDAFRCEDMSREQGPFDRAWADRVNAMLGEAFIVMHTYPIYVDFGNSAYDPFRDTWRCLGMSPSCKSAGFGTLEDARAYAQSLIA